MSEIRLNGACWCASRSISQFVAFAVSQHVGVHWEIKSSIYASPLDYLLDASGCKLCAAFGCEHVSLLLSLFRLPAVQFADFRLLYRMYCFGAVLEAVDV